MESIAQNCSMKKIPGLSGFSFEPQEAILARNQNRLLCIRIEINTTCNLQCRYCFTQCSERTPYEIELDKFKKVVSDAAEIGAKSVIITGGGEPMLHSRFKEIIEFVDSCGLQTVVFSNVILVTAEIAKFLFEKKVSVMAKLDSLHPATQDYLAGVPGAYVGIQAGLHNLIQAGFTCAENPSQLRLGVSFVANKRNIEGIEELWHFCRRNHVYPHIQLIYPSVGDSENSEDLVLSSNQIESFKQQLHRIDKEHYNFYWELATPFITHGCLQHYYSLFITIKGDMRPCIYTNFDEHPYFFINGKYPFNVFKHSLVKLYNAEPFSYARHIDKYLEGSCANCIHGSYCIGCRGYAYRVGVMKGLEPLDALRSSCQRCIH